jgi:predicted phage terminase large subunit-like protein
LLEEQARGGDQWTILELPAINERGDALWPEEYPLDALERVRSVLQPRDWSALYQQKPAPDEGSYFKREWFKWYDTAPALSRMRIYGASDYAVTDAGGDYTVHIVVGVDTEDNIYVLDLWRGQTASDKWIDALLSLIRQYKPMMWLEESGQIIKSIGPFLEKRMREEKTYCRREQVVSVADKPSRSRSIQARSSMGRVYLPHKSPWSAEFLSELLVFPAGKHDDQVDAFGLIGRMLDQMIPGRMPKVQDDRQDKWARAFARRRNDDEGDSWKAL